MVIIAVCLCDGVRGCLHLFEFVGLFVCLCAWPLRSAEPAPYALPRVRVKMKSIVREMRVVDKEFEEVSERITVLKAQFDKVCDKCFIPL